MSAPLKQPLAQYVITANDFHSGAVVFWGGDAWLLRLRDASVFDCAEDAESMLSQFRPDQVVGAYVIDVVADAGQLQPKHIREAIRARGPSNYFHGKQAEEDHVSL